MDALRHCANWFRAYYNSYGIPLKYFPALWGWIEGLQHTSESTGPGWLYRRGARPLAQIIEASGPDIVVATEVGTCELAALFKRKMNLNFRLVASPTGADVDRSWVQPEVDLYVLEPHEAAPALESWGAPASKIVPCGFPVEPGDQVIPERTILQKKLGLAADVSTLLVSFGGLGIGNPRWIIAALEKVRTPFQTVWIAGRNERLRKQLNGELSGVQNARVLGWVENMQEWMKAADVLLGKPGSSTVFEAINSGLPFLVFDPLPGGERRTCVLIEKWQTGHWIRRPDDLAPILERLLRNPEELRRLRQNALAIARPNAAREAAQAILNLLSASVAEEKQINA